MSEYHDLYADCVTEMLTFIHEEEFPDYTDEEIKKATEQDLLALTQGSKFNETFWYQVNRLYEDAVKEIYNIDENEEHFYNHEKYLAQVSA